MITTTIIVNFTSSEGDKREIPFKCHIDGGDMFCCFDIGENGFTLHKKTDDKEFLKENRMMIYHLMVDEVLHEKEDLINDWLNNSLN